MTLLLVPRFRVSRSIGPNPAQLGQDSYQLTISAFHESIGPTPKPEAGRCFPLPSDSTRYPDLFRCVGERRSGATNMSIFRSLMTTYLHCSI
ncbi:hypothetical protein K504DRAFT_237097 [Pleomassaria siparia CBS 279.74]|uniref:Uncharacterized protein n=1 Tax=Pleomassaria siparia CBS 279.74 TaxID=1314801 RepID=A0A6G1KES3_9PLEO|nr:hypothetical protein K504DRAFT_237097 [Pleomassaria siparia CBS 279.74]